MAYSLSKLKSGRVLGRKISNPLAYLADRSKKLRDFGQPYLVNVEIVLTVCSEFFLGNIYSKGLKFLQVIYENLVI